MTQSRARYLFALAHLCNCPPPVVDSLTVIDFALLVDAVEQHQAEIERASRG